MPFDFTEILGAIAPQALFAAAPLGDANFEVSGVWNCLRAVRPVYEKIRAGDRGRQQRHSQAGDRYTAGGAQVHAAPARRPGKLALHELVQQLQL